MARIMDDEERLVAAKWVARYPHLATLARNAERMPQAALSLGLALSMVEAPAGASMDEVAITVGIGQPHSRRLATRLRANCGGRQP